MKNPWTIIFVFAGLGNLANGIWMLVAPLAWYHHLPGGVPDFGPANEHFIRDLGCMFLTWGVLMLWAGFSEKVRLPITAALAIWFGTHALVHVFDTLRGLVGPEHFLMDTPLCYAPAVLFLIMFYLQWRARPVPVT